MSQKYSLIQSWLTCLGKSPLTKKNWFFFLKKSNSIFKKFIHFFLVKPFFVSQVRQSESRLNHTVFLTYLTSITPLIIWIYISTIEYASLICNSFVWISWWIRKKWLFIFNYYTFAWNYWQIKKNWLSVINYKFVRKYWQILKNWLIPYKFLTVTLDNA